MVKLEDVVEPIVGSRRAAWLASPLGVATLLALAVTAVYLATANLEHVVAALPFGLLLLCPLLHLFMHGSHGGHGSHGDDGRAHGGHAPPDRSER
jgi:hypothetical protein